MENWIPWIFLFGTFLSAIGCIERADYNFPVFLFGYIAWKIIVTLLFSFSIVVDIFWLIIIAWKTWFHPAYEKQVPWEHGIHMTITFIVWINFILKIVSIILSFFFDPKVK